MKVLFLILLFISFSIIAADSPRTKSMNTHFQLLRCIDSNNVSEFKRLLLCLNELHQRNLLHIAAEHINIGFIEALSSRKDIDINKIEAFIGTALHNSVIYFNMNAFLLLLSHKNIDPNKQTSHGVTPLHVAVFNRYVNMVKVLCKHSKVDSSIKDRSGATALHYAAYNNVDCIVYLVQNSCKPLNSKDKYGMTPLFLATRRNNYSVVKKLISMGADPDIPDLDGETPYDYAKEKKYEKIIKIISNYNRNSIFHVIDQINYNKIRKIVLSKSLLTYDDCCNTPLHRAMYTGNKEIIGFIFSLCPEAIVKKNKFGQTPVELAAAFNLKILKLLFDLIKEKPEINKSRAL